MEYRIPVKKEMDFSKYDTQKLHEQDKKHFTHPWTNFAVFKEEGSIVMAESEGVYVYDSDGNKYLDGIGGLWCNNIGYGNEEMAQTIADQIRSIHYYSTFGHLTTPPAAQLAAKLAALAPGSLNHVFYGSGGSMANDTAVRLIHFYNNRLGRKTKKKIITRIDGYHGSTYMAMSLTGILADHIGFDVDKETVHHVSAPDTYRRPAGMTEAEFCDFLVNELEEKINALGAENVAAFFAEPIAGAGGVLVPPAGYHLRTAAICKKYEVLYVSDEVVTGFGRLGAMFASKEVFDFQPDIITCAKGLTSGYIPLGATIYSEEIYEVTSVPQVEGGIFTHGFTYSGHPVACAAGVKNIEIMERMNLCKHVQKVGKLFENQLKERISALPLVGDVRGSHFMMCIESVGNKETKEILGGNANIGRRVADRCQERGLIVRPLGHKNVISPPLTLTEQQVLKMVDVLEESIKQVQDDLVKEGIWKE